MMDFYTIYWLSVMINLVCFLLIMDAVIEECWNDADNTLITVGMVVVPLFNTLIAAAFISAFILSIFGKRLR